jgi:hypothetical protein
MQQAYRKIDAINEVKAKSRENDDPDNPETLFKLKFCGTHMGEGPVQRSS